MAVVERDRTHARPRSPCCAEHLGRPLTVGEAARRRVFGTGRAAGDRRRPRPRACEPPLLRGCRGLAEAYVAGPVGLARPHRGDPRRRSQRERARRRAPPAGPSAAVRTRGRRSSRNSRCARARHRRPLDLGNDFFALMLDPTMMYSCALFERQGTTLEQASCAKLERVCPKLDLGPTDHVLEIGTGWGGFAVHAASPTAAGSPRRRSRASSTSRGRARARRGPRGPRDRAAARTTATCAGATTSSSRSR